MNYWLRPQATAYSLKWVLEIEYKEKEQGAEE